VIRFMGELGKNLGICTQVAMATGAIAAGIPSAYYVQAMLETWDWYVNRFRDEAVLDELRTRKFTQGRPPIPVLGKTLPAILPHEIPYSVQEISGLLRRSEKSVEKSLIRLRRRGRVESHPMGWTFRQ